MKKVVRFIASLLGVLLIFSGLSFFVGNSVAPETTSRIVYGSKAKIENRIQKIQEKTTGEYPTVTLGPEGGLWEMNNTYKMFIEMVSYRYPNVPPVYAAHNGYGGDIILNWEKGQKVNVVGRGKDGVYVVVGDLQTPKNIMVSDLTSLTGTIVLQSCFYGVDVMRFVELAPLEEYEKGIVKKVSSVSENSSNITDSNIVK